MFWDDTHNFAKRKHGIFGTMSENLWIVVNINDKFHIWEFFNYFQDEMFHTFTSKM